MVAIREVEDGYGDVIFADSEAAALPITVDFGQLSGEGVTSNPQKLNSSSREKTLEFW